MPSKIQFTRKLLEQIPQTEWQLETALRAWWANTRREGGLRLSAVGYGVFRDLAHLPCHDLDMDTGVLTPGNLIVLDRKVTCPYSFNRRRGGHTTVLTLFGDQEAMVATLYGDVSLWINNLKRT